mmetsp:Transcript_32252/g.67237  ORF Transcript_32252/g.67237 Transcript_32252/m.67237 type:complete len:674 (-) Transcript_32252:902-2923(-)|eukprot:CAMPEP_0172475250 /NCGR_PEP_ID=MMETSP1065-20121228/69773_1 /TAXON_ID=265537 /ORGANISM="Amphiprora paludosa, Strain CCMP125" /LENGTH=673 /DNA_ID=CAMNT_0013233447 /DNA_START=2005 /DNA_END=4026 /DNA_ORIENTATION=+
MDTVEASLVHIYNILNISAKDRNCLVSYHRIKTYKELLDAKERLETYSLRGLTKAAQAVLASALYFLEDREDILSFNTNQFVRHLMDGRKTINSEEMPTTKRGREAENHIGLDSVKLGRKAKKVKTSIHEILKKEAEDVEEAHKDVVDSNLLKMTLQGLRKSISAVSLCADPNFEKPENRVDVLELDGKTFRAGSCYNYRLKGSSVNAIVGIKYINKKLEVAKCVLVMRKSETFLGQIGPEALNHSTAILEECENKEDMINSATDSTQLKDAFANCTKAFGDYVQIQKDLDPLPLSNFLGEFKEQPKIPKLVYLPREGSRIAYGYFVDNGRRVVRHGRRHERPRLLELCCGAGGSHQGYKSESFETAGVVDIWDVAMDTFRKNNPDIPKERTFNMPVKNFLNEFKSNKSTQAIIGKVDVLHASPPCQGFSGINVFGGKNDEKHRKVSLECLEAVRVVNPDVFVYENVIGIWRRKYSAYILKMQTMLMEMGYQVFCHEAHSSSYGNCQKRPRFIMVAAKHHIPLSSDELLKTTHGESPGQYPFVTVGDVLNQLIGVSKTTYPNMMDISTTSVNRGETALQKKNKMAELKADELAPTVRGGATPHLHYAEERCINVREAAAIQGFTPTYQFSGTTRQMYKQIGNAVPLELALALAQVVKGILAYRYQASSPRSER